jgi:hypothetical protein
MTSGYIATPLQMIERQAVPRLKGKQTKKRANHRHENKDRDEAYEQKTSIIMPPVDMMVERR